MGLDQPLCDSSITPSITNLYGRDLTITPWDISMWLRSPLPELLPYRGGGVCVSQ